MTAGRSSSIHIGVAAAPCPVFQSPKTGLFFSEAKAGLAAITAAVKARVPS